MSDKIEYSRLLMKRSTTSGEVPTIPPITATTLNQFTPTDVFVGEFFLNSIDDLLWIRTENGILPIDLSGSTGTTIPSLTQVLFEGNTSNGFDIVMTSGDTIQFQGIPSGVTSTILGLDASGNTITTTAGSGTQSLDSVLSYGNQTGAYNIVVSSGRTIQYLNLSSGSTSTILGLDASGNTITTTVSSGNNLWTSGSTLGSVTTTVGSNTNTAPSSLVFGSGNTVTQTHSTHLSSNIVGGMYNTVDSAGSIVVGFNNNVDDPVGASVFGSNNIAIPNYSTIFGANNSITGGTFSLVSGGLNKINGGFYSAILGGSNNTLSTTGGRSVIIGGQGITGTANNMVYVPNLTIVSATTGTSISSLGIDSTGKVIKTSGPTLSQVLSSGNTTGGRDIIVSSGDTIESSSGENKINFDDSNNLLLSSDYSIAGITYRDTIKMRSLTPTDDGIQLRSEDVTSGYTTFTSHRATDITNTADDNGSYCYTKLEPTGYTIDVSNTTTGFIVLDGLLSFDDDTDAGTNGLTAGMVYQTTGLGANPLDVAGILMIKQ